VVILQKGGHIAQSGTPAEILAAPANDFVATFVGADKGKRALRIQRIGGRDVVVDENGTPTGVLQP
jgi:osmoprotectant transport system ATP-binding protein